MLTLTRLKLGLIIFISMLAGLTAGGMLFSDTQPRSFISFNQCKDCWRPEDLAGLVASVGIQKFPSLIPFVVYETDKTIVVRHPLPMGRVHYVIIPKRDIRDLTDISGPDVSYLLDAYSVAKNIIEKEKLRKYRFYTNGPGYQDMTYLHFHLVAT